MKIFVNVESRQLQTAVGDSRQVSTLAFKRGDGASVEIIFVRDGVQVELTSGSIVTFGAKLSGKYDANALVLENGFAISGSGSTASYIGAPSFNTVDLDAALEKDGDDTNDVPYLDLMGEISWTDGPTGEPTSTETFTVRVNNDVLRGDEVGPVDITGGTPVNQVEATGTITFSGSGMTSYTVTIGTETFTTTTGITWTATGAAAALVAEINAESTVVSASNVSGVVTITGVLQGSSANAFGITASVTGGTGSVSTSGANMTGGVTATAGRLGSMEVDSSYLYVVASVTDGVPLWKKIALSAL